MLTCAVSIGVASLRSKADNPAAPTLLLAHGWPGSIFEFYKVAPRLSQTFNIVAPSIPGYGFSEAPSNPGFGVPEAARSFHALMQASTAAHRSGCPTGHGSQKVYPGRLRALVVVVITLMHAQHCSVYCTVLYCTFRPRRPLVTSRTLLKAGIGQVKHTSTNPTYGGAAPPRSEPAQRH